jgi:hypothetical protein
MSKPQLSVRSNSLFACDPKLRVMCKMVVPSTVVLASVLSIVAVRPGVLSMIGSQWGSSWGARTGGREGGREGCREACSLVLCPGRASAGLGCLETGNARARQPDPETDRRAEQHTLHCSGCACVN